MTAIRFGSSPDNQRRNADTWALREERTYGSRVIIPGERAVDAERAVREIGRFTTDFAAWLQTPAGRFEMHYAEHTR